MKKQEFNEKFADRKLSRMEEDYVVSFKTYSEAISETLGTLCSEETKNATPEKKVAIFANKYLPYHQMCNEIYDILNGYLEQKLSDAQMKRIFKVLKQSFENVHTISDEYEKYTKLALVIHYVHNLNVNTKSFSSKQVLKKVNTLN